MLKENIEKNGTDFMAITLFCQSCDFVYNSEKRISVLCHLVSQEM